jgi:hypothetical protein
MTFKPTTSDEAVKKTTGKDWNSWFKLLDREQAYKLKHGQVAKLVFEKHKVKPWWSQMVANTYEQYKGLRKKFENPQGFEASVSRTIDKPIGQLYQWWKNYKDITITSATTNKYIRGIAKNDGARIDIGFYVRGKSKTQVAFQAHKLKKASDVAKIKKYWAKILEQLI